MLKLSIWYTSKICKYYTVQVQYSPEILTCFVKPHETGYGYK